MEITIINTIAGKKCSGTFTPVAIGTTTAGVGTYTAQTGKYNRVGNQIIVNMTIAWTAHTGTGNLRITTLPLLPNGSYRGVVICDNLTFSGELLCAALNDGTVRLYSITSGALYSEVAVDSTATLYISITYATDQW